MYSWICITTENGEVDSINKSWIEINKSEQSEAKLLENININEVSKTQKELLRYRILILKYLDRLFVYEVSVFYC